MPFFVALIDLNAKEGQRNGEGTAEEEFHHIRRDAVFDERQSNLPVVGNHLPESALCCFVAMFVDAFMQFKDGGIITSLLVVQDKFPDAPDAGKQIFSGQVLRRIDGLDGVRIPARKGPAFQGPL